MDRGKLAVMALDSGKTFARKIITHIDKLYEDEKITHRCHDIGCREITFANGEVKTVIEQSVRGLDLFIVQLVDDPYSEKSINDNIMAIATAVNAAHYSDAGRITAVLPHYPYSRQDKKSGRESITSRIFGNLMEVSGADKIITLDIHSEAIEGFFNHIHIENLHAGKLLINYLSKNVDISNLMIVAPDVGSAKRGLYFAKKLDLDLAIIEKVRDYSKKSVVSEMRLVGDVKNKNVFINDDMIATGGTLLNACKLLKKHGALDIYISVSLPFFSNKSYELFDEAYNNNLFKKVISTDAVSWNDEFCKSHQWFDQISAAEMFAQVIFALNQRRSVSKYLE